jgi:DnaJ homolog subfamily A member 5
MKECYYKVLGVSSDVSLDEIKKSYKKLALKFHPDKNSSEDAKIQFQLISEAYECLSDVNERSWYDQHKSQILNPDQTSSDKNKSSTASELYKYFTSSCYSNIIDDKNFFLIYRNLFASLAAAEENVEYPGFGDSQTSLSQVANFYTVWTHFASIQEFYEADQWNPNVQGRDRFERRAMENENKKFRQSAKKEYNETIRKLVEFVKRRDPRVIELQKMKAKEEEDKRLVDLQKLADKKLIREKTRIAAREEEEQRWKEIEEIKKRDERGNNTSDDEVVEVFECVACRKSFKSLKSYNTHENSKKHQQMMNRFVDQVIEETDSVESPKITEAPVITEPVLVEKDDANAAASKDADSDSSEEFIPRSEKNRMKREGLLSKKSEPVVDEEKKAKREKRKLKKEAKKISQSDDGLACTGCKLKFGSKNMLFRHLDENPTHAKYS